MSTTPLIVQKKQRSMLQLWRFEQRLNSAKVPLPEIALSKTCPFGIFCVGVTRSGSDSTGFATIGCSDGHVRLVRMGKSEKGITLDDDGSKVLRLGRNQSVRTSAVTLDTFADLVLVGYTCGICALFCVDD